MRPVDGVFLLSISFICVCGRADQPLLFIRPPLPIVDIRSLNVANITSTNSDNTSSNVTMHLVNNDIHTSETPNVNAEWVKGASEGFNFTEREIIRSTVSVKDMINLSTYSSISADARDSKNSSNLAAVFNVTNNKLAETIPNLNTEWDNKTTNIVASVTNMSEDTEATVVPMTKTDTVAKQNAFDISESNNATVIEIDKSHNNIAKDSNSSEVKFFGSTIATFMKNTTTDTSIKQTQKIALTTTALFLTSQKPIDLPPPPIFEIKPIDGRNEGGKTNADKTRRSSPQQFLTFALNATVTYSAIGNGNKALNNAIVINNSSYNSIVERTTSYSIPDRVDMSKTLEISSGATDFQKIDMSNISTNLPSEKLYLATQTSTLSSAKLADFISTASAAFNNAAGRISSDAVTKLQDLPYQLTVSGLELKNVTYKEMDTESAEVMLFTKLKPTFEATTATPKVTTERGKRTPDISTHILPINNNNRVHLFDHPPPIFMGGRRPSDTNKRQGEMLHLLVIEKPPLKVTKETPPPPIIIPLRSGVPTQISHATPLSETTEVFWKRLPGDNDPRFMSVSGLAEYTLESLRRKSKEPSKSVSVQQLFGSFHPAIVTMQTTTKSVSKLLPKFNQDELRSRFMQPVADEGIIPTSNIPQTKTLNSGLSSFQKPIVSLKAFSFNDQEEKIHSLDINYNPRVDKKSFLDSNYVFSNQLRNKSNMQENAATKSLKSWKPFFDSNYLLSHLNELPAQALRLQPQARVPTSTSRSITHKALYDSNYFLSNLPELSAHSKHFTGDLKAINQTNVGMNKQLEKTNVEQTAQFNEMEETKTFTSLPFFIGRESNIKRPFSDRELQRNYTHIDRAAPSAVISQQRQGQGGTWPPLSIHGSQPTNTLKSAHFYSKPHEINYVQTQENFSSLWSRQSNTQNNLTENLSSHLVSKPKVELYRNSFVQQTQQAFETEIRQKFNNRWVKDVAQDSNRTEVVEKRSDETLENTSNVNTLFSPNVIDLYSVSRLPILDSSQFDPLNNLNELQYLKNKLVIRERVQLPAASRQPIHPFPMASRLGIDEIVPFREAAPQVNFGGHEAQQIVPVSSIEIFKAPPFRMKKRVIGTTEPAVGRSNQDTHWQAGVGWLNDHYHVPIPYRVKENGIPETMATDKSNMIITTSAPSRQSFIDRFSANNLQAIQTTTTMKPGPLTPGTVVATVNPIPIFDAKALQTIMPKPKINAATKLSPDGRGNQNVTVIEGGIETRAQPIAIGSCSAKDDFQGLMDDVDIFEDCTPDDMYDIFMSDLE